MCIKFKIVVYRAKIQKKCAEYKKLAVSFNKIRYAQECTKKKLRVFLCHSIRLQYLSIKYAVLRNVQRKNCVFFFVIPFACSIFVKNKNITSWKYA